MKNIFFILFLLSSPLWASHLKISKTEGTTWEIYRVHLGEKEAIEPVALYIQSGDQIISLNPGKYYIANECSGQYFDIKKNEETHIQMHLLNLQLGNENKKFEEDIIPTECIHPVHKKLTYWNSKYYFNFFFKSKYIIYCQKKD